ncbi:MAG: hypothetical protein ABJA50_02670 [Chloroflexota bacterium]
MGMAEIASVLNSGMIGEISFADWLQQVGTVPNEGIPSIAHALTKFGVGPLRWAQWQAEDSHTASIQAQEPEVWVAYLVVTLPSQASRELIFDIAVSCRSFTFFIKDTADPIKKDKELWIEYQVARPEVTAHIEEGLAAGKIGEVPFIPWLIYGGASTDLKTIAGSLAGFGVTSIRFEPQSEGEAGHSHNWKSYIVVSLPVSPWADTPHLPSHELVHYLASVLRNPKDYSAWRYELRLGYEVQLPVDDKFEKWFAHNRLIGSLGSPSS